MSHRTSFGMSVFVYENNIKYKTVYCYHYVVFCVYAVEVLVYVRYLLKCACGCQVQKTNKKTFLLMYSFFFFFVHCDMVQFPVCHSNLLRVICLGLLITEIKRCSLCRQKECIECNGFVEFIYLLHFILCFPFKLSDLYALCCC